MTVRVRRVFEFEASPEAVWDFIADPGKRAEAISVVERYDVDESTGAATWHVKLPIPLISSTARVETEDVTRDPPSHVKFLGKSSVLRVTGEHTIEPTETGARLINEFVVDGRVPGVEGFFKRNLDTELENLERELRRSVETGS
ncbi:SRPBCC family protein [Halobellus clavatus]|jgi:carbon monoxide dehydrogenase subunit G|uniref:Carbon monoxide dehydrogenase subunit G n=1 Tax=Halobellus clavatus TaxID=660517 RepID=A0A1H3K4K4_9EURY|nr:SRPBCC family protein [Halobellus clavatus]SDY46685.1 Carbon monoxide dehydrogenase subunit G [Halobellus clavatus]